MLSQIEPSIFPSPVLPPNIPPSNRRVRKRKYNISDSLKCNTIIQNIKKERNRRSIERMIEREIQTKEKGEIQGYSLVSEGCEWTEKGERERERNWDK